MSKIILLTHQKGGVGKSTLCLNLAICLAKSTKVGIIDIDLQGSLASLRSSISGVDIIQSPNEPTKIKSLPYDFIIIDTPPYLSNKIEELMRISDLIIVPTKAGIFDLLAIRSTVDLIKTAGKLNKSLIVMNMIKPNTTLTLEVMIELAKTDITLAKTHISDLVSFTRSVIYNGPGKDVKAETQITNLTEELLLMLIS
ncbi:AAA family ATPase [Nonlabens sp. Asnod3-A02]|uniref:AAA family ATPase n=1 Tax=Nonlabens sp. Asnod3-A02 TaxID=3160579 RepID=UPI003866494A